VKARQWVAASDRWRPPFAALIGKAVGSPAIA
jgi:hypothetical protein